MCGRHRMLGADGRISIDEQQIVDGMRAAETLDDETFTNEFYSRRAIQAHRPS